MSPNKEHVALVILSSIMSIRMLGLFMILPVFSVYAAHLSDATPTLIGLTLGAYGLTQALFQIPCGMLSDHIGRKPVIFAGLIILLIGSIICAFSHSIYVLLLGRALQGTGAIGSTVLALLSDLTREESRTKAMAFMGLSIGLAFTSAMIMGPVINHWFHLSGIFWITGLLALIGMLLLTNIPTPQKPSKTSENLRKKLSSVLHNAQLLRLNIGIFSLHAILTAVFIAVPLLLTHQLHLSEWMQIGLYLCVLIVSFTLAVPFIIIAEKKQKIKLIFVSAIIVILFVQCMLYFFHHALTIITLLLLLFFTAFTALEATLPSLVSKIAPVQNKGAAMGIYSSSQFLGIFVGGSLGGFVFAHTQFFGIFALCAVISLSWLCVAISMKNPQLQNTNEEGNLG